MSDDKKCDESKEKSVDEAAKLEKELITNDVDNLKSEIMLVHEYAYHLKKNVTFEVGIYILLNGIKK